jgi:hypothetical protein
VVAGSPAERSDKPAKAGTLLEIPSGRHDLPIQISGGHYAKEWTKSKDKNYD